jgi:hypothetical protein
MLPDWVNILDHVAAPAAGGAVDVTRALQDVVDHVVPAAHPFLPRSDRREHGGVVYFPSLSGGGHYVLTDTVTLPGDKSLRLLAGATMGARLRFVAPDLPAPGTVETELDGAGSKPMFRVATGRRALSFENLILQGGGVRLDGGGVGPKVFRSCVFTDMDGWAIWTGGETVVDVTVDGCSFVETDRGIGVLHRACDNWLVHGNTTFVRLAGTGAYLASSGATLRDCRFESRQSRVPGGHVHDEPYVRITAPAEQPLVFSGGHVELVSCRFGGEVGRDLRVESKPLLPGPPAFAVEVGPSALSDTVHALRAHDCWFYGRRVESGPTLESARGAIGLHERVVDSVIAQNYFRTYFGPLVADEGPPLTEHQRLRKNYFLANTLEPKDDEPVQIFGNGAAWTIVPNYP